jgi:chromate transporter
MNFDPHLLLKLFFTFAWMSMCLFGGAYVFVPLLKQSVVDGYGWVTQREFADAVAMAQLMPGPAVISVVFVGFKAAGVAGAAAAAVGIFTPSAVLMISCARLFDRLKASARFAAALHGVRAVVVGMVFAAAVMIVRSAPAGWITVAVFLTAFSLLLRYRIDAIWLVPPAGLIGLFLY